MAQFAYQDPAGIRVQRSGGGFKQMLALMLAAAGVGFAGYVYLFPYHQMSRHLTSRSIQLAEQRASSQEAVVERDRLKNDLATYQASEKAKAETAARRKEGVAAVVGQIKPSLDGLGVTLTPGAERVELSFPADKLIDANGIDVSSGGEAALKTVAAAAKKVSAQVRIHAGFSTAPPPKDLKELFHNAGEVSAVRAARVMSMLQASGVAADHLTIVGAQAGAQGKKGADRVELEIEPE